MKKFIGKVCTKVHTKKSKMVSSEVSLDEKGFMRMTKAHAMALGATITMVGTQAWAVVA